MTNSKRICDICGAVLGLICLWPILLLVGVMIGLIDGLPIFFRQERVGLGGRCFRIWKFRTMVPPNLTNGNSLTIGRDPRVTRLGYWLRKLKVDELPQLFNVVSGEMSFVGPRPELPEFVDRYTPDQRRVLQLCPGITSFASIRFRNEDELLGRVDDPQRYFMEVIVPERARLDLEYAERANVWSDLNVILRTVVLLAGTST